MNPTCPTNDDGGDELIGELRFDELESDLYDNYVSDYHSPYPEDDTDVDDE